MYVELEACLLGCALSFDVRGSHENLTADFFVSHQKFFDKFFRRQVAVVVF